MTWLYVPYASSTDTADSSSDSDSPASTYEPWLVLSGTATQRPFSWPGWKRRTWTRRLSGMTSPRSTVARGVAAWISSLPVSTVSRSAQRGNVSVSMTSDGSGLTSPGSSLTWDRDTCSWRTSPDLFGQVCHTSAPTLPTSGSMRNGAVSQRQPLERLTDASGSGSWLTPTSQESSPSMGQSGNAYLTLTRKAAMWPTTTTMDAYGSGGNPNTTGTHGTTLTDRAVRMWQTPTTSESEGSGMRSGDRAAEPKLQGQAKMWPTPRASMNENRTTQHAPSHGNGHGRTLAGEAATHGPHAPTTGTNGSDGSQRADLNPRFVASLMGVPWDWLNPCTPVATDSYRVWLQLHSLSSPTDADGI